MKKYKITKIHVIIGYNDYYQLSNTISKHPFESYDLRYIESLIPLRHEYKKHYKTYQEYRF